MVGAAVIIVLCVLTAQRAWLMRGQIPLWRETIAKNPGAWMAYYHLGTELANEGQMLEAAGRPVEARQDYQEAADLFEKGLKIQPAYSELHSNLGIVQIYLGMTRNGIEELKRSLEIKPSDANAWNSLGFAQENIGDIDDAITSYRRALTISPGYPLAQENLRHALAKKGLPGDNGGTP